MQVQLVLEDDEAVALEELDPLERRPLQVPPVILVPAGGNAHEQPSVAREHAPELAQRRSVPVVVRPGVEAVHRVVAPDMLERRDAEREVEVPVFERQVAYVGDDVGGLGEVGRDELGGAELPEPLEIRGNRVGRPDVEDAPLAGVPREAPRDLDRALVAPGGRVIGAENIFVADASVMPLLPTATTNIPTIMVAEKLAATIDP